jgi:hypothetical protein
LDTQKTKQLCDAIRGGADLQTAAHFAGFNVQTVYRWLELGQRENERLDRGENPDDSASAYLELWLQLRKARADAVMRNVAQIQKAANQGEWKAAAWWLERQLPDTFS